MANASRSWFFHFPLSPPRLSHHHQLSNSIIAGVLALRHICTEQPNHFLKIWSGNSFNLPMACYYTLIKSKFSRDLWSPVSPPFPTSPSTSRPTAHGTAVTLAPFRLPNVPSSFSLQPVSPWPLPKMLFPVFTQSAHSWLLLFQGRSDVPASERPSPTASLNVAVFTLPLTRWPAGFFLSIQTVLLSNKLWT